MDIVAKHRQLVRKFRALCYSIGVEFMDIDYEINIRTVIVGGLIIAYLLTLVYTLFTAEKLMVCQCLVSMSVGVQGAAKFPIIIIYRKIGLKTTKLMADIYTETQRNGRLSDEYKLLSTCLHVLDKIFKLYLLIFLGGLMMACGFPAFMYYVFNEKNLIIYTVIPGVDPFGQYGFVLHAVFHFILGLIGVIGLPAGDIFFMLRISHIYLSVEFIRFRIQRLNNWLLEHENLTHDREWHKQVTEQVNAILVDHQNLLDFMGDLDEVYFYPIAFHIGSSTISLGIAMFMTVTTSWYVAYMYVIVAVFQLLVYSTLGSIVELKNDHLTRYIYDTSWYLLPVAEQKKIWLLLEKCQTPTEYMIAGLEPLTLDTCVRIFKTIYSFFMMLLETI